MVTTITQLASLVASLSRAEGHPTNTVTLPHSVHSVIDGWLQTRPNSNPTHLVELMVDKSSYMELGLALPRHSLRNKPSRRTSTNGVCDTGAMLNIAPTVIIHMLGYSEAGPLPCQH